MSKFTDFGQQLLGYVLGNMLRNNDPIIRETHIDYGTPVRNCGPKGRHRRIGVDRASDYGQRGNARKNTNTKCSGFKGEGVPRCCAVHLNMWRAANPGNGKCTHENWNMIPADMLFDDIGRETTQSICVMEGEDYFVKLNPDFNEYTLCRSINIGEFKTWGAVCIRDCLIDAQRIAANFLKTGATPTFENGDVGVQLS